MPEYISESLINQLRQYLQQKPAREPAVHRGHRVRNITGGRVNRKRPLDKYKSINSKIDIKTNDPLFVTTASAAYVATARDWHISADCRINQVAITLPLAASVAAGKQIAVKESWGVAPVPFTVSIAAAGADTLEKPAVGMVFGAAGQSVVLISDGVSNWEVTM